MKHSKILLVAIVSAVVAVFTSVMGVTGTILGSVLSSVLYNVLVEVFEKPIDKSHNRKFNYSRKSVEWEIAYVFPLVVIALLQITLIIALLSSRGFLPSQAFLLYSFIQDLTNNNLYRIMGIGLLIISIYPFVLNANIIKKWHGMLLIFVGLIFLSRGLMDSGLPFSFILYDIFSIFDLYIAIFAFIVLLIVIMHIASHSKHSKREEIEYYQDYNPREDNPRRVRVDLNDTKSFNSSSENIKFDSRNFNNYRKK